MIKAIEFPNLEFSTKELLFAALKSNEQKIISIKKEQIYKSAEKGQLPILTFKDNESSKNLSGAKLDFIYPIISTTNYFDSHGDVHFNGCFNKTVKEQQGKIVYALDHELKYNSILAWEKDVKMVVKSIDWNLVGKDYEGDTQALIFEIPKEKIRDPRVLSDIESKSSNFQNSIRMIYHKIKLGINSNEKDFAENKAYFDSKINSIVNKELVEEMGYFWGVEELGIYKEGSLVVGGGSNDATSIYIKEPMQITQEVAEPSIEDTQKENLKQFFNLLKT